MFQKTHTDDLIVATATPPGTLAGAIATQIRNKQVSHLQAIGAGAINQAVKAIAIARGLTAPGCMDLVCTPSFQDIFIEGQERTAIRFKVEVRP